MTSTNGLEEGPGRYDELVKERFTPFTGADGSLKEFDGAVGYPRTLLKVSRRKVLDGSVCCAPLPARHFEEYVQGVATNSWTAWAWPEMTPSSKKKALKSMPLGC